MEDRELLELAARAVRVDHRRLPHAWPEVFEDDQWNPLDDDGDALRLAVMLGILLRTDFIKLLSRLLNDGMDKEAATRRAITMIAADIGRLKVSAQAGG